MALSNLTAKANVGAGSDLLATVDTAGGAKAGAVALVDGDGELHSTMNPVPMDSDALGSLLEEINFRLADIADSVGNLTPDALGRLRTVLDTASSLNTISTVTTVSTVTNVTTLATLANQTNIGGIAAVQQIFALTQIAEQALRQNIVIS